MKKTNDTTVKKLFRTFGFILVLLTALFFIVKLVSTANDLTLLDPIRDTALTIYNSVNFFDDYVVLIYLLGFILLIFTIKNKFLGVIMTLFTIALLFYPNPEKAYLFGVEVTNLSFIPTFLEKVINNIINIVFLILTSVLLNLMLINKKPKRFSLFWINLGTLILVFGVILKFVNIDKLIAGFDLDFVVNGYFFVLGYALVAVGSVFGILGFRRNYSK